MYLRDIIICLTFSLTLAQKPKGKTQPDGLVGGRNPKVGEVKYIVAIHSSTFMCGGGIIDEKYILTAAHCVTVDEKSGKLEKPIKIIAGTNVAQGYNKAQVIEIDVARAFLPSLYYFGNPDDIAVLELTKKLDFVKYRSKVQKLRLPHPLLTDPSRYPSYEGELVKFAGYGNTYAEIIKREDGKLEVKRSGAGPLKVADARIVDSVTCKKYFKKAVDDAMCLAVVEDPTKKTPQGTCTGDSGSPAVYQNDVLVGLDSMGKFCDNNKAPTLFTRVSSYVPFIKKAMSNDTSGLIVYEA